MRPTSRASGSGMERSRRPSLSSSSGKLIKVAYAQQQAEAEMIQGLLSEYGIPSMLRRAAGFCGPDFLSAGPRGVLFPQEPPAQGPDAAESRATERQHRHRLLVVTGALSLGQVGHPRP